MSNNYRSDLLATMTVLGIIKFIWVEKNMWKFIEADHIDKYRFDGLKRLMYKYKEEE